MRSLIGIALTFGALALSPAFAAEDMSDTEFAKLPAIVVAHWTGEAPEERPQRAGRGVGQVEHRISVIVEYVIKGDIKRGNYDVLLQDQLYFNRDGGGLWRTRPDGQGVATEPEFIYVRTDSLKSENIWFLYPGRSVDRSDKRTYWILDRIRGVQPAYLSPYYRALVTPDPAANVVKLLDHPDPRVVARALAFLAGGRMPEPDGQDLDPGALSDWRTGPPHVQYAALVKPLLRHQNAALRTHALATFGRLAGDAALPVIRQALEDPDGGVYTTAIGLLATLRDEESIEAIVRAAVAALSKRNAVFPMTGECVLRVAAWNDERLVPVLLCTLQSNPAVYRPESPNRSALLAQHTLYRQTGFVFPLNRVQDCLAAWQEASQRQDFDARLAALQETLEPGPMPFEGRLVVDPDQASGFLVELMNRGVQPITVPREPTGYLFELGSGGNFRPWFGPSHRRSYVTLEPGERVRSHIPIPVRLLAATGRRALAFASFGKLYRPTPGGIPYWKGSVFLELPPREAGGTQPNKKLDREIRASVARLMKLASGRQDEKARRFVASVGADLLDSWQRSEASADRLPEDNTARVCGMLRVALHAGTPKLLRMEVLPGKDDGRRGPPIYVKIRFGEGPSADTLLLVMRRIDGTLLLGEILTY